MDKREPREVEKKNANVYKFSSLMCSPHVNVYVGFCVLPMTMHVTYIFIYTTHAKTQLLGKIYRKANENAREWADRNNENTTVFNRIHVNILQYLPFLAFHTYSTK